MFDQDTIGFYSIHVWERYRTATHVNIYNMPKKQIIKPPPPRDFLKNNHDEKRG
jgi:hypothetical protein